MIFVFIDTLTWFTLRLGFPDSGEVGLGVIMQMHRIFRSNHNTNVDNLKKKNHNTRNLPLSLILYLST